MILRRVIEHVRTQNWTAVAIDFVIVVVGVFIGIQVANWNARMADQRLGADYEKRLATDLKKDLDSVNGLYRYYVAVLESVLETDALLGQSSPDAERLVTVAYRATEINFQPVTRATWDQIVSSGHLGLLPAEVTDILSGHFAADALMDAYESLLASDYRQTVRQIIPLQVQQALRSGCSDKRTVSQEIIGFMSECALDIEPRIIAEVADELKQDSRVREALNYQFSEVFSAAASIDGVAHGITAALAALGHKAEVPADMPDHDALLSGT